MAEETSYGKKPGGHNAAQPMRNFGVLDSLPPALRHDWLLGVFLVVVTFLAYYPAWHAGFIWDDNEYVTENPLLTARDGLWRIWFSLDSPSQYFPLTYTTFYIERSLWGLNSTGYHLINLLLHAVNGLLVWRVLARLRVPGAWVAAMIFALHPVQVESVAWITERKNVLMGFFFLFALLTWIKFIDAGDNRRWKLYWLTLLFYTLALFAKTTACTLPVALLLILWLKKMSINWRSLAQVAPFFALGIAMGLVTVWWEQNHQGTKNIQLHLGLVDRVLIASRAVWFYAGKLLWPANLSFSYPRWNVSASDTAAYRWLLAAIALGIAIWRTSRWTGRSVAVALAYFVATLGPVLGFIMLATFMYTFVADHYQYLACIGLISLTMAGANMGLGRISTGKSILQPILCAALLLALGSLTWKQCGNYADAETLWRSVLQVNPASWMARNNLGAILVEQGKFEEAIEQYNQVLELKPDYARAHYNYGLVLAREGRNKEAAQQLAEALQIQPTLTMARKALGLALANSGDFEGAAESFRETIQSTPDDSDAYCNLALALSRLNRTAEAVAQYRRALEVSPPTGATLNNLAWILASDPNPDIRNGAEAVRLATQACELTQNREAIILGTLGAAYAEAGRFEEAVVTARKAEALAAASGNKELADKNHRMSELFSSRHPYHEPVQPAITNTTQSNP